MLAAASALGILRIDGPGENPIKSAEVTQKGRMLIVKLVTRPEVALTGLRRFPDLSDARAAYLCAEFDRLSGGQARRLCVGGGVRTGRQRVARQRTRSGECRRIDLDPVDTRLQTTEHVLAIGVGGRRGDLRIGRIEQVDTDTGRSREVTGVEVARLVEVDEDQARLVALLARLA